MADEPQVIRGIDWKATFPFTLIFRSFRIAVHPSKLVLALAALLLIYFGGRVLDAVWPTSAKAVPDELAIYVASRDEANSSRAFAEARDTVRKSLQDRFKEKMKQVPNHADGDLDDLEFYLRNKRNEDVAKARKSFTDYVEANKAQIESNPKLKTDAADARDRRINEIYVSTQREYQGYVPVEGIGLFRTFFEHQLGQAHRIARRAREANFIAKGGALDETVNFFTVGPAWLIRHHPVFATLFGVYFLAIWAIFGGAIARIAAVQVARDEKISFRQALSFSASKFLSFVSAPIIPMVIVVVVGLVVFLGALLMNIPFLGPIAGGALFILALAAGFVMTLVLIGLFGGFNLMYPTVAVEGSDSFDAISRSFSYLYARPWRLAFYTIVAAVYGVICYVFVRFFIKLMLSLTHAFVGMGIYRDAGESEIPLWPVMWSDPLTATRLSYNIDWMMLGPGETVGAFLVAFWVYLVIAMLGAFAISFYFSANTIIYVLMRYEVDATELDDVYLEQTDEDFGDIAPQPQPPTEAAAQPPADAPPAPPADQAPPPAGG